MVHLRDWWERIVRFAQALTYDEHARYLDFNHRVLMARVEKQALSDKVAWKDRNIAWPDTGKGVPQVFMRSAMPLPGGGILGMRSPLICHTINRSDFSRRRSARRLIGRIATRMRDGCVTKADRTMHFTDEEYRDLHDYCVERGAYLGNAMGDGHLIINGRSLRLRIEPDDMSVYLPPLGVEDM